MQPNPWPLRMLLLGIYLHAMGFLYYLYNWLIATRWSLINAGLTIGCIMLLLASRAVRQTWALYFVPLAAFLLQLAWLWSIGKGHGA